VVQDHSQNSTDLMKCLESLQALEAQSNVKRDVIFLGGLSGRLDQTVHTLSFLHKQRDSGRRLFVVSEDNVAWVLNTGESEIEIDLNVLGPTCGLLPVGVSSAILSTSGLKWNLDNAESSFDGLVSTSNAIVDKRVWIKTSAPIWWCVELRR